ncbi:MAG: J domain-containing protein [Candidatus Obscuribacterales bacterium]|nr:J domain-containing protein [Candidatus Obscuribacterales bacterium]
MSTEKKTYYQILGLETDVSAIEIKRAYRRLVKIEHPDLDHRNKSESERLSATESMLALNVAYETLMDKRRRAQYDLTIGLAVASGLNKTYQFRKTSEDELREVYLAKIFHPSRLAVTKVLSAYKRQIRLLSQDPFDDELIAEFEAYVNQVEVALAKSSNALAKKTVPATLEAAVHMMRHCIAQAADGLEELRHFCQNYDYDHLAMADNLFRIASDLAKQALALTRSCS